MKNTIKQKEGFTLLITIIGLALMTTLGFAILTATTNNFKATEVDSKNQRAYYIAEAGINYTIDNINSLVNETSAGNSDAFFSSLNNKIDTITIKFDENFGTIPTATITIIPTNIDASTKQYLIESRGIIGKSSRTLTSTISIKFEEDEEVSSENSNVIINVDVLKFNGMNLRAPGKTIVIKSQKSGYIKDSVRIIAKNIYIDDLENGKLNGAILGDKNDPGNIHIDSSITHTQGDLKVYGNLVVDGDVNFSGSVEIYGDVKIDGKLNMSGNSIIKGNAIITDEVVMSASSKIVGILNAFGDVSLTGTSKVGISTHPEHNYVEGNLSLSTSTSFIGSSKVSGDLFFEGNPTVSHIIYDGKYIKNGLVVENSKNIIKGKVNKEIEPKIKIKIPKKCKMTLDNIKDLKSKGFKTEHETNLPKISSGEKWFVKNYNNNSWHEDKLTNVTIVSKEDINIGGTNEFIGALIAPNGIINYSGYSNFKGVLISKDEINITNDVTTTLQSLDEYFGVGMSPLTVECNKDSNSPNESDSTNTKKIQLDIIKKIREK